MIVLRQKEYVSAEEKEAKMQLAHGILEAREQGNKREEKRLKRRFTRKDKTVSAGIGAASGAVAGGGSGAAIGAGIGYLAGRRIGKNRLNNYLDAARKERYGYSDDSE